MTEPAATTAVKPGLADRTRQDRSVRGRAEPKGLAPRFDGMSRDGAFWRERCANLLKEINP